MKFHRRLVIKTSIYFPDTEWRGGVDEGAGRLCSRILLPSHFLAKLALVGHPPSTVEQFWGAPWGHWSKTAPPPRYLERRRLYPFMYTANIRQRSYNVSQQTRQDPEAGNLHSSGGDRCQIISTQIIISLQWIVMKESCRKLRAYMLRGLPPG